MRKLVMNMELYCVKCNRRYSIDDVIWRCDCGSPLDISAEVSFPLVQIEAREPTLWRYREPLPIFNDENIISLGEGFTPLVKSDFGNVDFFLKVEYLSPSGSFKDRGAAVLVSKIKELGIKRVVEDSSGNAGSSIAIYCASAGIECEIYAPASVSPGKLAQIQMVGAKLIRIPGSREEVAGAALEAAHCRNQCSYLTSGAKYGSHCLHRRKI